MSTMNEAPMATAAQPGNSPPVFGQGNANLDLLADVAMRLSVEVGATSIPLAQLLRLSEGSVVELDRQANDYLDIFANGTLIAKGEVVVTDGRYGVRVVEVVSQMRGRGAIDRRS